MKSKHWVGGFLLVLFLGIGAYMAVNFYANPLGYFTNEKGLTYNWTDDYGRSIKAKYILKHKDEIQGMIMGGSKSGQISTAVMEEYTGLSYYNLYYNMGNFADYLRFTKFLLDNTDIQEITLHLSSYETLAYDRTYRGSAYKVPAVLSGNVWKEATEFLGYLMTNVGTTISTLKTRPGKNTANADDLITGMKRARTYLIPFAKDPDAYVRKNVIKQQATALSALFVENDNDTDESHREARTRGIEALRKMKELCDERGVTLRVFIGASFLDEKYTYECDEYYSYLRQIVEICGEVWDFSDYCDVNMNPYNFINDKHFTIATSDLMLRTMFGAEKKEGFGTLLTKDNIYPYLAKRKADYERLKAEYLETGTVQLQGIEDDSYIPLDPYFITQGS